MPPIPAAPPTPEPTEAPALLRAALDLSGRLLTVEAAAHRVRRRLDDEAVHDFRVSCRRLSSAMDLWGPVLEPDSRNRTRRLLRRLRRRLTSARDLEMMTALFRDRLLQVPAAARIVLEARLGRLERRLDRERDRAASVAARAEIARVRRGLLRAVRRSTATVTAPLPQELARRAVRSARERAHAALSEAWAHREDRALHRARIRVKAWRYARETAADSGAGVAEPGAPALADLRALQQALGRVQDLVVALRELERRARRARRREQPARADALQGVIDGLHDEKSRAISEAQRRSTILSMAAVRGRAGEA